MDRLVQQEVPDLKETRETKETLEPRVVLVGRAPLDRPDREAALVRPVLTDKLVRLVQLDLKALLELLDALEALETLVIGGNLEVCV